MEPRLERTTCGWLNGLAGVLVFSGSLPATRGAVADFHPVFLTGARAVLAALLGTGLLLAGRQRRPARPGRSLSPWQWWLSAVSSPSRCSQLWPCSASRRHLPACSLAPCRLATTVFAVLDAGRHRSLRCPVLRQSSSAAGRTHATGAPSGNRARNGGRCASAPCFELRDLGLCLVDVPMHLLKVPATLLALPFGRLEGIQRMACARVERPGAALHQRAVGKAAGRSRKASTSRSVSGKTGLTSRTSSLNSDSRSSCAPAATSSLKVNSATGRPLASSIPPRDTMPHCKWCRCRGQGRWSFGPWWGPNVLCKWMVAACAQCASPGIAKPGWLELSAEMLLS